MIYIVIGCIICCPAKALLLLSCLDRECGLWFVLEQNWVCTIDEDEMHCCVVMGDC